MCCVRHRAARLPSDSGCLMVREHAVELRLSRPFPSPLATITGDIASAQSYVAPFPPRVLVIAVPPSTTRHDPEPVASPRHLSARTAHAFTAGTPLSLATHDLNLAYPPWAAPVGHHGHSSTLPHSPATMPAREHPRTCTHTHARRSMAPRVPVLLAPAIALPTTQALVVRRLAEWPRHGYRQTRPVSHRTHSGRPSALAFRGHRSPRCQLSKPLAVLHRTQARHHGRLRRHDHGHLHRPPHGPV